ncbi:tRNA-2-methylthio-N6-dimethylallyladenosine synthase [Bartonella sp. WD12.1]|nr:tRNA-2-methylthio-N6-dimethylallyladenosine synthase [Bartonella sp. WD12.1]
MNTYDSQRMNDSLSAEGYVTTQTPNDADLILVNTCHIREKAAEKLYSDLGRLRMIRQKRAPDKPLIIGVTGCVAQAEGNEILRRANSRSRCWAANVSSLARVVKTGQTRKKSR